MFKQQKSGTLLDNAPLDAKTFQPQNKNFMPTCSCRDEPESPFGKRVDRIIPKAVLAGEMPVGFVGVGEPIVREAAVRLCGFPKFG